MIANAIKLKILIIANTTCEAKSSHPASEGDNVSEVYTVFANHRKSLIQQCERSKLRLHFEWTKVNKKMPKMVPFGEFLKT